MRLSQNKCFREINKDVCASQNKEGETPKKKKYKMSSSFPDSYPLMPMPNRWKGPKNQCCNKKTKVFEYLFEKKIVTDAISVSSIKQANCALGKWDAKSRRS